MPFISGVNILIFDITEWQSIGLVPTSSRGAVRMPESPIQLQTLTRRCNEALILTSLERGPKHGYQLALDLEERGGERFSLKHGTLYPILHDLEKRGLIEGAWSDEGPRGKRKSYRLTASGKAYAKTLRDEWGQFMDQFRNLLSEEES